MEEEMIAKVNKREVAETTDETSTDTLDGERPEMPEEMEGMGGGPMGGGFQGEMTMATNDTNEWLVPMTATGIISGVMILATVAVCLTIFFTNKKN